MVSAKYLKLTRLAVETYSIKTKQKVNKRRKGAKLKRVQDSTTKLIPIPKIKREHKTEPR